MMSETQQNVHEESLVAILMELRNLNGTTYEQGEEMKKLAKLLKVMNKKDKEYFAEKEYTKCKALYKQLHDAMRANLDMQKKIVETIRRIKEMKRKGTEET